MTGGVAGAISGGLTVASVIVRMVHDLVRDAISDVIGKLASKVAIGVLTAGLAAPWAVSTAITEVSSWVTRLSKEVTDVVTSSKNLKMLLDKAEKIFSWLAKKWESFKASRAKKAEEAAEAATDGTKSAEHAADAATDGAKGAASAAGAAATSAKRAGNAADAATDGAKGAGHAADAATDGAKNADHAADAAGDAADSAADGARGADDAADAAADGSRGADGSADGPSFNERHRPEAFGDPVEVKKGDDLYPGERTPFARKSNITLEPNTHYRVERPGGVYSNYYTDASGNVTHVECHSKWETGYLNADLQNPLPNATYSVDGKFHYVTDEYARTTHMEGYSGGGGVGVEHEGGCDGLWECVQGASVVLLEDLPGLDVGVDLLDYVPDPVDAAADLLGGVGELFAGRLPWWGDHPPFDVALVGDPPADVEALEQAGGVQGGDVMG